MKMEFNTYKFHRGEEPTKRLKSKSQRAKDMTELQRRQVSSLDWILRICDLSVVQHNKMSRKSFEQNVSNADCMEQYKSILFELLSKKDDSFPIGVRKEPSSMKTQNKDSHDHDFNGIFPLFVEQINGLTKNDNKRLKHTLNEIIALLNADVDEVDQDVQAMVENSEVCQDNVKELSAGLMGKLSKMAQSVDDLLNTAVSRCRPMTTEEKIELGKRIRKLPEEALNCVVEIIAAGKPGTQSSEKITIKLGELDDAILWRLYYHVEYVRKDNNV